MSKEDFRDWCKNDGSRKSDLVYSYGDKSMTCLQRNWKIGGDAYDIVKYDPETDRIAAKLERLNGDMIEATADNITDMEFTYNEKGDQALRINTEHGDEVDFMVKR